MGSCRGILVWRIATPAISTLRSWRCQKRWLIDAPPKRISFQAFALRALGTTYQALAQPERAYENRILHSRSRGTTAACDRRTLSGLHGGLSESRVRRSAPSASASRRGTTSTSIGQYRQGSSCVISSLCGGSMRRSPPVTAHSRASTAPAITKADAALELGRCDQGLEQPRRCRRELRDGARDTRHGANRRRSRRKHRTAGHWRRVRAGISWPPSSSARTSCSVSRHCAPASPLPSFAAFYPGGRLRLLREPESTRRSPAHRATGKADSRTYPDRVVVRQRASASAHDRGLAERGGESRLTAASRPKQRASDSASLTTSSARFVISATDRSRRCTPKRRSSSPLCANDFNRDRAQPADNGGSRSTAVAARASPLPYRSSAAEIQASLDDRSVLLQYALGSPRVSSGS